MKIVLTLVFFLNSKLAPLDTGLNKIFIPAVQQDADKYLPVTDTDVRYNSRSG